MKRFLKIAGCVIAAAAALGILAAIALLAAFFWWRHSLDQKIATEIALIKAEGYPTNAAELDAFYKEPSPGENATELYQKAFAALKLDGFDDSKLPFLGNFALIPFEAIPIDVSAEIGKCLEANGKALALVDKAARMKHCRFPMDYSQGCDIKLPHLKPLYDIARLLALDSLSAMENGDSLKADSDYVKILGIAEFVAKEPNGVSPLLANRMASIAMELAKLRLEKQAARYDDLQRLGEAAAKMERFYSFKPSILGELCLKLDGFAMKWPLTEKFTFIALNTTQIDTRAWWLMLSGAKAENQMELLKRFSAALKAKGNLDKFALAKRLETEIGEPYSNENFLCMLWIRGLYEILLCDLDLRAKLGVAHAAFAAQRFALDTGSLPESLEELLPKYIDAVPEDPFDGKPLKYRKGLLNCGSKNLKTGKWKPGSGFDPFASKDDLKIEKPGFVVYSVGLDGKDDKAEDCCDFFSSKQKDICFPVFDKAQAPESRIPLP